MALLKREEWQGFVRDVDWSYSYVDDEAVYPEWHSGTGKVPRQAWLDWEESYKVSYPEYVATQREKEAAVYAVKAALQRSSAFDSLTEGWKSATKMHFGGVALVEYAAVLAELKMARFGLNGSWRNMATFGQLDELRHAAVTTFFGHEFIGKDAQYDWTQKTFHTNDWVAISLRNLFDAMMTSANVVDIAIELPLTFETGFTNLQFVALAADALASGDVNFANMISSIQTDEARHSQQGGPTLEILVEHDPVRAQWVVDKAFWGSARAFAALTGPAMDYYTPLEHRKQSYREFMEEWIIDQFVHTLEQYGLKKPWYWDEFLRGLDIWHHGLHMGLWFWRPTIWWRPMAAVSRDERAWLAEKYPNWEQVFGDKWDVIIDNVNSNNMEATLPETLPWLCSTCHLPACNATQSRNGTWRVRDIQLSYDGRIYHFCTNGCRQIFWKDRDNVNHETVIDRFLAGQIQPMDVGGIWRPGREQRHERTSAGPAERHLRHRLRADPRPGHHREHHGRGGGRGSPPCRGQAGAGAALRQGRHLPGRTASGRHDRRRRRNQAARSRHGRIRHSGGVMKNPVGPVLRMGDEVELIIAAIEDDNPGTDIEVIDRGAYVRVQGEDQITVTEETLRRYLGADYEIRSFGGIMSAFNGRVITTSDAITWQSVALGKKVTR